MTLNWPAILSLFKTEGYNAVRGHRRAASHRRTASHRRYTISIPHTWILPCEWVSAEALARLGELGGVGAFLGHSNSCLAKPRRKRLLHAASFTSIY